MATVFPTAPADNQVFAKNGQQWRYSAAESTWTSVNARYDNSGSVGAPLFGAYEMHEDIFGDWNNNTGIFQSYGGAGISDSTSYATTLWNNDNIMRLASATNVATGPGIRIDVPAGYDTVWLRRHQSVTSTDCEVAMEYAWNTAANYIGQTNHYGSMSMTGHIGPNGFAKEQRQARYNTWCMPMHLPDRLGGTIFISQRNTTGTRDEWFGGFAFSRNDRHLTMLNAITGYRGNFGGNLGTYTGNYWGMNVMNRGVVSVGTNTEVQRLGMYCINATGGDKILSIVTPRDNTGNRVYAYPWLEVSNLAGTVTIRLTPDETSGADLNPISEAVVLHGHKAISVMSYRIPAVVINAVVPISDGIEQIRIKQIGGTTRSTYATFSYAYLYDA